MPSRWSAVGKASAIPVGSVETRPPEKGLAAPRRTQIEQILQTVCKPGLFFEKEQIENP
jgi:hypothetical protein